MNDVDATYAIARAREHVRLIAARVELRHAGRFAWRYRRRLRAKIACRAATIAELDRARATDGESLSTVHDPGVS
jgi:hypothetical protein